MKKAPKTQAKSHPGLKTKSTAKRQKASAGEEPKYAQIKLGIDVHAVKFVVARMCDAQNPQPAQSFTPEEFLDWARRQQTLAQEVHAVYEAGPFGYQLYRQLRALGIQAHVIQPQIWDERKQGRKTDKSDARQMVLRLDRFVAGNTSALNLVRVPTEEEETRRIQSRLRETLKCEQIRVEAQGRSLLLSLGIRLTTGKWWQPAGMRTLSGRLDPRVLRALESYRTVIQAVRAQLLAATRELRTAASARALPIGLGALSDEQIEREICHWPRFQKAKQVSSYTGLCPGEHSTGARQRQGQVNKCGNRRLRTILVEAAWRLVRYQPDYAPVQWFAQAVARRGATYRKRAITAVARRLAIDLWRLKTGRASLADLHLRVATASAPVAIPLH